MSISSPRNGWTLRRRRVTSRQVEKSRAGRDSDHVEGNSFGLRTSAKADGREISGTGSGEARRGRVPRAVRTLMTYGMRVCSASRISLGAFGVSVRGRACRRLFSARKRASGEGGDSSRKSGDASGARTASVVSTRPHRVLGRRCTEDIARLDARGFSAGGVDGVVSAGTRAAGTRVWHSCGRGDALPVLAAAASCQGFARALSAPFASSRLRLRNAMSVISDSPSYPSPPCTACGGGHHAPQLVCGMTADSACACAAKNVLHPRFPTPARAVAPVNVASALGTRPTRVAERSSTTAAPLAARRRMRPRVSPPALHVGGCQLIARALQ